MKFYTYYTNEPPKVSTQPDTETVLVSQSEAIRSSLKYQLEVFGMDTLQAKLKETQSKFGYADTRYSKSFGALCEQYARANDYFQALPAEYRAKFGHDPIKFYSSIEQNPGEAYKTGFISKDLAQKLGVVFEQPKIEAPQQPVEVSQQTVEVTSES